MDLLKQQKIKLKQECGFLGALKTPLAASLLKPVTFSVVKGIKWNKTKRAARGYMNKCF